MSQDNLNICPECGNKALILDKSRGEIICDCCGLVVFEQRILNDKPEWRAYSAEEAKKKVRVGSPTNFRLYDKGLTTTISKSNRDAYGKVISPKTKSDMRRLIKWHNWTKVNTSTERNLKKAMNLLEKISSQLTLRNSVKDSIAHLYRKIVNKGFIKGRSIEGMLIAATYFIIKLEGIPKTFDDILKFTSHEKKKIIRYYKFIVLNFNKKKIINPSPIRFIARFCSELNLSVNIEKRAIEILCKIRKSKISWGKDPKGLIGAAIYIGACEKGEHKSQRKIAKIIGITEETIRRRSKDLIDNLRINGMEISKIRKNISTKE